MAMMCICNHLRTNWDAFTQLELCAELEGSAYPRSSKSSLYYVGLENRILVVILFILLYMLNPWQVPELESWLAVQVGGYVTEYDKLTFCNHQKCRSHGALHTTSSGAAPI